MNDLELVRGVVDRLADAGVHVWVTGGWAEQLLGHEPARLHLDVDLLYPAESWKAVDRLGLAWVGDPQPHRRAFAHEGVLVKLFLVRRDALGHYTEFPEGRRRWPDGLLWGVHGLRVARAA